MESNQQPPIAGKPPFATDVPDSYYDGSPVHPGPRLKHPDENQQPRTTSAYDVYDDYVNAIHSTEQNRESGTAAAGPGFLNNDMDDESDSETIAVHIEPKKGLDDKTRLSPSPPIDDIPSVPIVAPKPGYATPVSAITLPEPIVMPVSVQRGIPQMAQMHRGAPMPLALAPVPAPAYGRVGYPVRSAVPRAPHPLQPPMTPITPAFARPPKEDDGVKFEKAPIMRGKDEEVPLARRGQKGDEFWRRFSMVVKDEDCKSTSSWLRKSQSGAASMSRMVWCVGILLVIIIGAGIGVGLYITHNSKTSASPKALGGSAGEGSSLITTFTSTHASATGSGTSKHVTPTNTVARRWPGPEPSSFLNNVIPDRPEYNPSPQMGVTNFSSKHHRKVKRRVF